MKAAPGKQPGVPGVPVLLTHPDRNTQNERKATQSNAKQRTQGKQNQRSRNNTNKPKTEHRGSRTLLETTNDHKPKPTHQPQAAPIETTNRGLPQPRHPSQPNLPRTSLDPTNLSTGYWYYLLTSLTPALQCWYVWVGRSMASVMVIGSV